MIVSLDDLKNFLGLDLDDTTKDSYYTSVLQTAEAKVKAFFGGEVALNTYTETKQFRGKVFYTRYFPIVQVISLSIDNNPVADFVVGKYFILLKNEIQDFTTLSITYKAGFETLPQEIYTAIILTAVNIIKLQTDQKSDEVSDMRMQREIEKLLLPYRRFPV
jgi:hypothetical protein